MFYRFYIKISDEDFECYYIHCNGELTEEEITLIKGSIGDVLNEDIDEDQLDFYIEFGPHLNMITPWCSNAMSIFKKCGINKILRIEKSQLISRNKYNDKMIDPMLHTIYLRPLKSFDKNQNDDDLISSDESLVDISLDVESNVRLYGNEDVEDINDFNKNYSLGFDQYDIDYYTKLFKNLDRPAKSIELLDLAQSNSEHSRHWFFKGRLIREGKEVKETLFQMIKNTQKFANKRSVVAFSDNASSITGFKTNLFYPNSETKQYSTRQDLLHITFTAETHNFPTGIAPFPGAATGTGGRIRDGHSIGRGGFIIAGTAGYCVGNIFDSHYKEKNIKTLIEASNGASDYGNKFGEPLIQGFCRAFGMDVQYELPDPDKSLLFHFLNNNFIEKERIEWVKPIMFTGGIGMMLDSHKSKYNPSKSDLIIKLGGPAYKIGLGGGAASSREHNTKNKDQDFSAVQRGDPQMENRLNRVIRACIEKGVDNPIRSIHDQGAGGTANVTKEIIYPNGGIIELDKIELGDHNMTPLDVWVSEYQEQDTILVKNDSDSINFIKGVANRENLPVNIIGHVDDTGKIEVYHRNEKLMDLPLEPVLGDDIGQKIYYLKNKNQIPKKYEIKRDTLLSVLKEVFRLPSVGSKRFLTNKVDRSVTGLIAQQQCVGPLHTPLSDYAIVAQSFIGLTGGVTSIGEQPIKGFANPEAMARMTIGEMLTNMVFAKITSLKDIRCSGNWMWPLKFEGEMDALYRACSAMCDMAIKVGIAFDGGKDSLSMSYKDESTGQTIKCPRSLVVSGYAPTEDIRKHVTPDFKSGGNDIFFIDLANGKMRMGGSAISVTQGSIGSETPDVESCETLVRTFEVIQNLVSEGKIVSGHDRSDGGLITCLCEMAFAGNLGFSIILKNHSGLDYLFNEELGLVIETEPLYYEEIKRAFKDIGNLYHFGKVEEKERCLIVDKVGILLDQELSYLRDIWESTSFEMELKQTDRDCAISERDTLLRRKKIKYSLNPNFSLPITEGSRGFTVAVLREEGSNGDREMAAAFYMAGFKVMDVCINDLLNYQFDLDDVDGIAFVGGFSYSDVFGAAKGWYQVIQNNRRIKDMFDRFHNRTDTFAIGVCNGCQLMTQLGWTKGKLEKNKSRRFESRFANVRINKSDSIFLSDLENSILGVWLAHGEGRFTFPEDGLNNSQLGVIQYIDDDLQPTETYPMNPNGSVDGIAAVTSEDGRFLSIMPHPERSFLNWQLPIDLGINIHGYFSPWFYMFQNAYKWCENNRNSSIC